EVGALVVWIHNLPYTGRGAGRFLSEWGFGPSPALSLLPEWARDSLLGIGLATADVLTTVSPTYARGIQTPEGGYGLDATLRARSDRLRGILNGIDLVSWNPAGDSTLRAAFVVDRLDARAARRAGEPPRAPRRGGARSRSRRSHAPSRHGVATRFAEGLRRRDSRAAPMARRRWTARRARQRRSRSRARARRPG